MNALWLHIRSLLIALLAVVSAGTFTPALAHKPSDSFLTFTVEGNAINVEWHIALRDLEYAIGLDDDRDGKITWAETQARHQAIIGYATERLKLSSGGSPCILKPTAQLVDRHTDGAYSVLRFVLACGEPANVSQLTVDYSLLFDLDPQHRGLIDLRSIGDSGEATHQLAIAEPNRRTLTFGLHQQGSSNELRHFIQEGVWHIWIGFDHILFLLALLIPAVLIRRSGEWQGVASFRNAFWNVAKVVTAFTIAHSVTLSLASLQLVSLPSRLVEATIAASVILAAFNNIYPMFDDRRTWMVAFVFGLIHGFGFASVLGDFGLEGWTLVTALVSFNVGVELGQLCIVAAFLPIAFSLRNGALYRRGVMLAGSAAIVLIAFAWFVERAFNLAIFG